MTRWEAETLLCRYKLVTSAEDDEWPTAEREGRPTIGTESWGARRYINGHDDGSTTAC